MGTFERQALVGHRSLAACTSIPGGRVDVSTFAKLKSSSAQDRSSSSSIAYWVQQFVLNKWYNASNYRKKKEPTSLPGLQLYGSTVSQTLHKDILSTNMHEIEQVFYQRKQDAQTKHKVQVSSSEGHSENPDADGWNPYLESDSDEPSSDSAAVPVSDQLPHLQHSTSGAIVPYNALNSQTNHANSDNSQNASSNTPAANDFRARPYAPVAFQAEMYSRITFIIGPSQDRNGHMSNAYARIMGLEEAQKAETFRTGVFERFEEMGEVVGSRKVVAKPDWMSIPFVVDNDHDHHYLLEALKTWGNWKAPGLSVVYVSLEHEV